MKNTSFHLHQMFHPLPLLSALLHWLRVKFRASVALLTKEKSRGSTTPDWTSLPDHLLSSIAKHLHTRVDVLRFRAVCNSFRHSVPLPPSPISPHPHLNLPIISSRYPGIPFQLQLTHSTVYAFEPLHEIPDTKYYTTKTWFVNVKESREGKVKHVDPLHSFAFKGVPNKFPKALNLLDYRVKEITKMYGLLAVVADGGKALDNVESYSFGTKVAVSSSLDKVNDGFAVVALYTEGHALFTDLKMAAWRKGDEKWTHFDFGFDKTSFEDIIYHNGKFYAFEGKRGLTIAVDPKSLDATEVAAPLSPLGNCDDGRHLVESGNDLFLVDKYFLEGYRKTQIYEKGKYPIHLKVYKLDKEKHEWVELMDGLEDRALCCAFGPFCVSAQEFLGCRRNSVYFMDDILYGKDNRPAWDVGIFDCATGIVGPVTDFPAYSKVFWPPPPWLKK